MPPGQESSADGELGTWGLASEDSEAPPDTGIPTQDCPPGGVLHQGSHPCAKTVPEGLVLLLTQPGPTGGPTDFEVFGLQPSSAISEVTWLQYELPSLSESQLSHP